MQKIEAFLNPRYFLIKSLGQSTIRVLILLMRFLKYSNNKNRYVYKVWAAPLLQAINVGVYYYILIVLNGLLIANLFPSNNRKLAKFCTVTHSASVSTFELWFSPIDLRLESPFIQFYSFFCSLHFLQYFSREISPFQLKFFARRHRIRQT